MRPELIFFNNSVLLEGPCWDKSSETLYFVSIKSDTVFALDVNTGRITSYPTSGPVGCAVVRDGKLLTAEKSGIFETDMNTLEKRFVTHVYDDPVYRYNDGKTDPKGRFFVGTIGDTKRMENKCALYRVNSDGSYDLVIDNATVSNGLGWSSDGKTMYYIDTPTHKVRRYDYDIESGTPTFRDTFAVIEDGVPDGMCVDVDDTIWVAHWGGGKVSHWDTLGGKRMGEIELPVKNVSSCCVGGKDDRYLYITTAKSDDESETLAGGLFRVKIR